MPFGPVNAVKENIFSAPKTICQVLFTKKAPGFKKDCLKPGQGSSPIDSVGKKREF